MTSIKSHHYRHHHHPYYTHHYHENHSPTPAPKPSPKPSNPTKRTPPRPHTNTTTNASKPHQTPSRRSSTSTSNKDNSNSSKRCFTWLLTPSGTMHWAKNRSSFRTYSRAPTKIAGTRVLGVGTVELKVRRGPSPDEDRMNTLVLSDVLHVPNARCNGICLGRYCEMTGDRVEVDNGPAGDGNGEEVRVFSEGESSSGSASEGEVDEDEHQLHSHGHGHSHKHGEALWYGEGYHGCSRVVLWGDPHGSEDLDNVEGNVDIPGVDASAEELDTLFTRVKERSLV
ncbi:hypothetical protein BJX65DRAFT_89201 [Aspergillus insuetus]